MENLIPELSLGLTISLLLLLIAYIDLKNSVTGSRQDKEAYIESRLDQEFRLENRFDEEKQIKCKVQKIWVTENDQWWYAFKRYTPFVGGFSGTTTVQIASNDMSKVDPVEFMRRLSKFPLSDKVIDVEFHLNSLTLEFNTANAEEVEQLFRKARSLIVGVLNEPAGARVGDGIYRPIIIDVKKPNGLLNRFSAYFLMKRLRGLEDGDEVIIRDSSSRKKSNEYFGLNIYSSKDGSQEASSPISEVWSFSGLMRYHLPRQDTSYEDYFNNDSEVIKAIRQLEIIKYDLVRKKPEKEQYQDRQEVFEYLPFTFKPSKEPESVKEYLGKISLDTQWTIFSDSISEDKGLEVGEESDLKVPIRQFIPSAFDGELEFRERLEKGFEEDNVSKKFLKEHSDAVAVTCCGYSLESYYERGDGEYFSVRWIPGPESKHKVWQHARRVEGFPLERNGLTIWERTD